MIGYKKISDIIQVFQCDHSIVLGILEYSCNANRNGGSRLSTRSNNQGTWVRTNLAVKLGKLQGTMVEQSKTHVQNKFEHTTREILLSVESTDYVRKKMYAPKEYCNIGKSTLH